MVVIMQMYPKHGRFVSAYKLPMEEYFIWHPYRDLIVWKYTLSSGNKAYTAYPHSLKCCASNSFCWDVYCFGSYLTLSANDSFFLCDISLVHIEWHSFYSIPHSKSSPCSNTPHSTLHALHVPIYINMHICMQWQDAFYQSAVIDMYVIVGISCIFLPWCPMSTICKESLWRSNHVSEVQSLGVALGLLASAVEKIP